MEYSMADRWRSPFRAEMISAKQTDKDDEELVFEATLAFEDVLTEPLDIAQMLEKIEGIRRRFSDILVTRACRRKIFQLFLSCRRRALGAKKRGNHGEKGPEAMQRDGEILSLLEG